MLRRYVCTAVLAVLGPFLLTGGCGFRTIRVDEPPNGLIVDDPGPSVFVSGRVGSGFDEQSIQVRLDGVDLIAALGLVVPFQDQGGAVSVGADTVTVTGFSIATTPRPIQVELSLDGLDPGAHTVEIEGQKLSGPVILDVAEFELLPAPFDQAAHAVPSSLRAGGPESAGAEGILFGASLGLPFAGPRVALADGGELRAGFVEAAEALMGTNP